MFILRLWFLVSLGCLFASLLGLWFGLISMLVLRLVGCCIACFTLSCRVVCVVAVGFGLLCIMFALCVWILLVVLLI